MRPLSSDAEANRDRIRARRGMFVSELLLSNLIEAGADGDEPTSAGGGVAEATAAS